MFGYIRILKPELKVREYNRYRAYYCGLCRVLKQKYGLIGEMTLTYDMTFLVMLLSSLYEQEEKQKAIRCEVNPLIKHSTITTAATAYGADMNLLLAYYKEKDDWQDEKDKKGLILSAALRRKAERIEKQYPRQTRAVIQELSKLGQLEQSGCPDADQAADSFGRLLGELFVMEKDLWQKPLYELGFYMGRFIYLADAWDDLAEDEKSGQPNPFKGQDLNEEVIKKKLTADLSECAARLEYLPLVRDAEIFRNIIYAGVWTGLGKKKRSMACQRESV